ncbi:MAG: substrate-binding domain-containing protein [Acidimicrobiales bacterium]|nr:substrate-binding domain-containing protein [Acidimicrobiales bacterium]
MTTLLKRLLALLFAFSLIAAACGSNEPEASDDGASDDSASSDDGSSDDGSSGDDDGSSDDSGDDDVDLVQGTDLTFYMITHSDDGPFWSVLKRGAEQAATDLGVELVWQGSNNDPAVQAADIDAAVASGADGIAASLPSPDQLIPGLKAAVDAGIPVYTLNSGVNDYEEIGATTHVGQTEVIAGNGAGQRFNADGRATKILCGRQEQDNVALNERCDGLAETFDGEVISEFMDLDADTIAQQAAIRAAMEADPDIDGFMGVGPVIAMSGLRAAQDLGRDVVVGGFDITSELIDSIEDGDVLFTVDQQQYLQGYIPVLLMFLEVTNKNTLGGGLPILTGPGFVTQDNAADVKALVAAGTR